MLSGEGLAGRDTFDISKQQAAGGERKDPSTSPTRSSGKAKAGSRGTSAVIGNASAGSLRESQHDRQRHDGQRDWLAWQPFSPSTQRDGDSADAKDKSLGPDPMITST